MGIVVSLFLLVVFLPRPLAAQTVSARGLSETEKTGLELFLQRCAVCHLGPPPRHQTYGPLLHQEVVAARGDDVVRKKIMEGSQLMPGFQYTLKPVDINKIIAWLKAVKKADVTPRPSNQAPADGD